VLLGAYVLFIAYGALWYRLVNAGIMFIAAYIMRESNDVCIIDRAAGTISSVDQAALFSKESRNVVSICDVRRCVRAVPRCPTHPLAARHCQVDSVIVEEKVLGAAGFGRKGYRVVFHAGGIRLPLSRSFILSARPAACVCCTRVSTASLTHSMRAADDEKQQEALAEDLRQFLGIAS
jgi:hypothetical protein